MERKMEGKKEEHPSHEIIGVMISDWNVHWFSTGSLRAEVVGPGSTLPVSVTDNYGQTVVAFVPQDEGKNPWMSVVFIFILH